jgi:hypothetical protein
VTAGNNDAVKKNKGITRIIGTGNRDGIICFIQQNLPSLPTIYVQADGRIQVYEYPGAAIALSLCPPIVFISSKCLLVEDVKTRPLIYAPGLTPRGDSSILTAGRFLAYDILG